MSPSRAAASAAFVRVLQEPAKVGLALSPLRRRLLRALGEEDSATSLARRLGLARQRVNYHLRALERAGILDLVEERPRRGCIERIYRLSARAFVVDPNLLGDPAAGPVPRDRFSSAYLLSVAARLVSQVGALRERAARAGKRLLTQTLETEIRFETPQEFERFSEALVEEIARLARKHGAGPKTRGKTYRLILAAHPAVGRSAPEKPS